MAITKYFVKQGLVQKSRADILGGFNLNRFFKWMASKLHITMYDDCCDEETVERPTRFNTDSGVFEYYDGTEWVEAEMDTLVADSISGTSLDFTSAEIGTLSTNTIQEADSNAGITLSNSTIRKTTLTAHDVTATATADEIKGGTITSTSAAAVGLTLPTATEMATSLGAARGTTFDFFVDNGVGANTVTVIAGAGMTASSALTGGTTLTVASGVVGQFRLYFQSGTTAKLSRIA